MSFGRVICPFLPFCLSLSQFTIFFSAIIISVPLITPIGAYFGIAPIHLAIIFIANLELGFLTPPVGMNLFLSAYRFNEDMPKIYQATLPFFVIKLLVLPTMFLKLSIWSPAQNPRPFPESTIARTDLLILSNSPVSVIASNIFGDRELYFSG